MHEHMARLVARVITLLTGVLALTTATTGRLHAQAVYQDPITITDGGIYTGAWQSLDPGVAAITIQTTAPVIITDSYIMSKGLLIDANYPGADVTVVNTSGLALNPEIVGWFAGRFIEGNGISRLVVEHNYFEGTRGVFAGRPPPGATILVRYNSVKNLSGRQSTGSGWTTSDVTPEVAQLVQFDKVTGANAEIAWNQVINEPYVSRTEDVINMYASAGTLANPILIHDNYIRGAYPGNPDVDGFSGGGIIADGADTGFLKVYGNQIIETVNYGLAIADGHDNEYYGNTVLGTGLLPSGGRAPAQNVGMYVNGGAAGNIVHDNTVGWYDAFGSRNDAYFPGCPDGTCSYNNIAAPEPITLTQEDAEFTTWQNKLAANGITVGPPAR